MSTQSQRRYGVLVPVKPPAVAKSRLADLGDYARRRLVVAFAVDTVVAALESPLVDVVLAVTDDHELARVLADQGAHVLPDGAAGDLNASLVQAARELARRWPDLAVAALCADLPALRPTELTAALEMAPQQAAAYVADAQGSGTTLLLAPDSERFAPHFGPGSASAHHDAGAVQIELATIPSLRLDVDTRDDLDAAIRLGVGARTAMSTTGLRL